MRPFGDHLEDGLVQISFTFPVPNTNAATEMVRSYVQRMGLSDAQIIHQHSLDRDITHFTLYAASKHDIDYHKYKELELEEEYLSKREIEKQLGESGAREIVVVGAATGTDTHSLGIDAILNMKGYNGEYGLERYSGFKVYNLGSQVSNEDLIDRAIQVNADVVLVSQTVTQQGLHKQNLRAFKELSRSRGLDKKTILICGGAHLPPSTAQEVGFDACFSKGCLPNHVGTYILRELNRREYRTNA